MHEPARRTWPQITGCAVLLMVFVILSWLGVHDKSATIDEPLHAIAGVRAMEMGDFLMNTEDPPLWKYWAMLDQPAHALRPNPATSDLDPASGGFLIATKLLYQTPGNDGAAFINRSRAMMLVLGALLGCCIAAWSWQLAGAAGALVATALYALDPNFLAHAPLVKNDVAISLVLTCIAWATWSVGKSLRWWNALLLMLLCAAAVTVKFSGLIAGPMAAILLLLRAISSQPWAIFGSPGLARTSRILVAGGLCLIFLLFSGLTIWACYRFRFQPAADADAALDLTAQVMQLKRNNFYEANGFYPTQAQIESVSTPLFARTIVFMHDHRLLPQSYLFGALLTRAAAVVRPSYLMGETSMTGWWYYFPIAMLSKTPLATLAAVLIAVFASIKLKQITDSWTCLCLMVPLALYGGSALLTNLNLGIRHILPIYPFLYVLIGLIAAKARLRWPRQFKPAACILAAALVVEVAASFPYYISFFNVLARPHRLTLLSDSNFDWGQDLPAVARWQAAHPDEQLHLAYWGPADPAFYKIRYLPMPGGFAPATQAVEPATTQPMSSVAMISATLLQTSSDYRMLRGRTPDEVIGDSIFLYRLPPD